MPPFHCYQHEFHILFFFIAYQSLHTVIKRIKWPTDVDFKGVIHGLLRVQYTYHLDICKLLSKTKIIQLILKTVHAVKLANGFIRDRETSAKLFVDDLFFLAKERIDGNNPLLCLVKGTDYALAIEWAEAALE